MRKNQFDLYNDSNQKEIDNPRYDIHRGSRGLWHAVDSGTYRENGGGT